MRFCKRCQIEKPLLDYYKQDKHCRPCRKIVKRAWFVANRDKVRLSNKIYNREWQKADRKKRMANDIQFRIRSTLKGRMRNALKGSNKLTSAIVLLGCSISTFTRYLEKQFKPGMTWENYGYRTWHIDHIIPCASFDLTRYSQQRKCFHYTNLQPLWRVENQTKGANLAWDLSKILDGIEPNCLT